MVNDSEEKPQASPSSSIKSIVGSPKASIEIWLDKDAHAQAFIMFNMKETISCQFQDKDDQAANKLWEAIKSRHHRKSMLK